MFSTPIPTPCGAPPRTPSQPRRRPALAAPLPGQPPRRARPLPPDPEGSTIAVPVVVEEDHGWLAGVLAAGLAGAAALAVSALPLAAPPGGHGPRAAVLALLLLGATAPSRLALPALAIGAFSGARPRLGWLALGLSALATAAEAALRCAGR